MNRPHYDVPAEAPVYVKNWLKHCRSRTQLWALVTLSMLAALATVFAERGKATAFLGLAFLLIGVGPFLAVRWGERHHFFDQSPTTKDDL